MWTPPWARVLQPSLQLSMRQAVHPTTCTHTNENVRPSIGPNMNLGKCGVRSGTADELAIAAGAPEVGIMRHMRQGTMAVGRCWAPR